MKTLKTIIIAFPQMLLIIFGLPFYAVDLLKKNNVSWGVLNNVNIWFYKLEKWKSKK